MKLNCEDCKTQVAGTPNALVKSGWKWLETRYKNKVVRIALCPKHSSKFPSRWKDLLAKRINADPKDLEIEVRI